MFITLLALIFSVAFAAYLPQLRKVVQRATSMLESHKEWALGN